MSTDILHAVHTWTEPTPLRIKHHAIHPQQSVIENDQAKEVALSMQVDPQQEKMRNRKSFYTMHSFPLPTALAS